MASKGEGRCSPKEERVVILNVVAIFGCNFDIENSVSLCVCGPALLEATAAAFSI
jgi:hypothetical protein